jgi:hypothetical protein
MVLPIISTGRCAMARKSPSGFSLLKCLLPDSIHAVTARGFELKVFLFVLARSVDALL